MLKLVTKAPPHLAGAPEGILKILDSSDPVDLSYASMPSDEYWIGEFKGRVNTKYGSTEFEVQTVRPYGWLGIAQEMLAFDPVRAGKLTVHNAEPPTLRALDKDEADLLLAACLRRKSEHARNIMRVVTDYRDQLMSAAPPPELLDPALWRRQPAARGDSKDLSQPNGDEFVRADGLGGRLAARLFSRHSSLLAQLLTDSRDGIYLELHYRDQLLDYKQVFGGRSARRLGWMYQHLCEESGTKK